MNRSLLVGPLLAAVAWGCGPVDSPGGAEATDHSLRPEDPPMRPPPIKSPPFFPSPDREFKDCWVVFVHGTGHDYHDWPQPYVYWEPSGFWSQIPPARLALPLWVTNNESNCHSTLVGYQGLTAFGDEVTHVARQIRAFIDREQIPDHKLILIGHSMGGLMIRQLLNLGEPNAPGLQNPEYRPGDLENFAVIKDKAKHAITLLTPHFGSEGADALYGEATRTGANLGGSLLDFFGVEDPTRETECLRRSAMEEWANDNGDAGRTTTIWAIAGNSTTGHLSRKDTASETDDMDGSLALAPQLLFSIWAADFPNDGLVEERSASGTSILKDGNRFVGYWYSSDRTVQGAFRPWLRTPLNHNHGRLSDMLTIFGNMDSDAAVEMNLGDKIRLHGLDLPCSDPGTAERQQGLCN